MAKRSVSELAEERTQVAGWTNMGAAKKATMKLGPAMDDCWVTSGRRISTISSKDDEGGMALVRTDETAAH